MRYAERYTDLAERGPDIRMTLARPESVATPVDAKRDRYDDVRAIVDTGADICVIRHAYADDLGLQKHDERQFANSTGCEVRPVYRVDLIFKDGRRRPYETAGCDFRGQNIEFLLGRNFLAHVRFSYDGPLGGYELEFE